MVTRKMRHACMAAFDDHQSANKTRFAGFIADAQEKAQTKEQAVQIFPGKSKKKRKRRERK